MYDKRHYYRKMPTYMDISRQGGIDVCMREKKKKKKKMSKTLYTF